MTAHFSDNKIIESWRQNVVPWTRAVREKQIESRRLVTDQAIVNTVTEVDPQTALDIGCGEGWLARALALHNIDVMGVDVVAELVAQAQHEGGGRFLQMSYEDIGRGLLKEKFDVAVCNFSLLGKESVEGLFRAVTGMLNQYGYLIIQTLHPVSCCDNNYVDGWRSGSWQGFSGDFKDPAPWYFRTIESWVRLFEENKFQLEAVKEPVNPETGERVSMIMVGRVAT